MWQELKHRELLPNDQPTKGEPPDWGPVWEWVEILSGMGDERMIGKHYATASNGLNVVNRNHVAARSRYR